MTVVVRAALSTSQYSRDQPGVSRISGVVCRLVLGGAYRMSIPRDISKGVSRTRQLACLGCLTPVWVTGPPSGSPYTYAIAKPIGMTGVLQLDPSWNRLLSSSSSSVSSLLQIHPQDHMTSSLLGVV